MTFNGAQLPSEGDQTGTLHPGSSSGSAPNGRSADRELELVARKILAIGEDAEFELALEALQDQFPGHPLIWATRVRRLVRQRAIGSALALIDAHEFGDPRDDPRLYYKAELLFEAREFDRAETLFRALIEGHPHRQDFRAGYAKRLLDAGYLVRACELLVPVRDRLPDRSSERALADRALNLLALLNSLEGRALTSEEDSRILAMRHAILHFKRRSVRLTSREQPGPLSLITGGLGPGGAERQLTRLAIELEEARRQQTAVGALRLPSKVEVVVRSHGPDNQNNFYLADLLEAGVELHQMTDLPAISARRMGVDNPALLQLLSHLPPAVTFGVERLTPHFAEAGTETASIWQDGACLFAGLAALIAGVPHIQFSMRGLPPSVRRHMYRPEYEVFYRAMAEVPGVRFVSNSNAAAKCYAEWLDFDLDRFEIVYNGVEPMSSAGSADCEQLWREFEARTEGSSHTVGGVFRFDTDKQPLTWIRFAARYLKRHEGARFVLVGGGRLLEHAVKLAEDYGIDERILFVGRSTHVGYWMRKMQVLVLLSRYEGLPNVLIEAQYMGVHVVTTPAGGAPECLIDGVSGHVLECAERLDYQKVIDRVHELASREQDSRLFEEPGAVRKFLDTNFSIEHMVERFVACLTRGLAPAIDVRHGDELWGEAA